MPVKIIFYGWKIDEETDILFSRMIQSLIKMIKGIEIETFIKDVASYGEMIHEEGWGLAFGRAVKQVEDRTGRVLGMPEPDLLLPSPTNDSYRKAGRETLQTLAEAIQKEQASSPQEEPDVYLETAEGVSVGIKKTDIEISPEALTYIGKLKELLGGKVVITKGDVKLEIE